MRFVSRSANYMLVARPDADFEVFENREGTMLPRMIRRPILIVEFKHGMVRPDESYAATMHWQGQATVRTDPERLNAHGDSANGVYGAVPYQRGVSIQDGVGRIVGVSGSSRPDFNFSLYDTTWLEDAEDRADAEKALLENADNGVWYVKVDAIEVPLPWPNYNKVRAKSGSTIAAEIARRCEEDGYEVTHVIDYEKTHANRPTVLEALEALGKRTADEVEAAEALTVQVV